MMAISGCSVNSTKKTEEKVILVPDSLLISPCKPINLYDTPRVQGQSQIHNHTCVNQYETTLQGIRDWKQGKLQLYKEADKK